MCSTEVPRQQPGLSSAHPGTEIHGQEGGAGGRIPIQSPFLTAALLGGAGAAELARLAQELSEPEEIKGITPTSGWECWSAEMALSVEGPGRDMENFPQGLQEKSIPLGK